MALADFQSLVSNLIRDYSGEIADADRDQALSLAVTRYSTDRPRTHIEAVLAGGTTALDLPQAWEENFSTLRALGIPGQGEIAGKVEQTITGTIIRTADTIRSGTNVHVSFTVQHVLDENDDTIPPADREAVASWAAALLLEQLASYYAGAKQSTIDADSVDWQSKSRDFAGRAARLRKLYQDHLGIDPKRNVPAAAVVDLNRPNSLGRSRLIKGRGRI
ncbi:conserved protein [Tepidicaulis marinus]|uniref:Conserved protein n=1 Tax=Tepidicaulis marinus TaxID=1333998 RepID=A0A081B6D7_9HYPH|nr:hypothetical protein [Tepidicaulis marinus]GAK43605.1 conserved protein [Tepidicaulis marinus]